jgi:hypothetical protein
MLVMHANYVKSPGVSAAIVLFEMNRPSIAVVLEVEQDAGQEDSIDRMGLWAGTRLNSCFGLSAQQAN